jgi:cyclophilin family peptidyl-prolyl cis-trans isomerase
MKVVNWIAGALLLVLVFAGQSFAQPSPENTMTIKLKDGDVVIELLPDIAPGHVARIRELAAEGAYDNVAFHRVIDGFMAQTGDVQFGNLEKGYDPRRVGTGSSDKPDLKAEFSDVPFDKGVVGMARAQNPDSANSQFFIMLEDYYSLNGNYTVFGRVIDGMEHVTNIKRGDPAQNGVVDDPDRMISVRIGQQAD